MTKKLDHSDIGARIQTLRKAQKWSQTKLGEETGYSKNTVSDWEKGNVPLTMNGMASLCKVLDCDIGHLMGEYEAKRHKTADIQEILGISEKAAQNLQLLREMKSGLNRTGRQYTGIDFFSALISDDDFITLISICLNAREVSMNKFIHDRMPISDSEQKLHTAENRLKIIEGERISLGPSEYHEYLMQAIERLANSTISIAILESYDDQDLFDTIKTLDCFRDKKQFEGVDADAYMKALMGYRSEKTISQEEP